MICQKTLAVIKSSWNCFSFLNLECHLVHCLFSCPEDLSSLIPRTRSIFLFHSSVVCIVGTQHLQSSLLAQGVERDNITSEHIPAMICWGTTLIFKYVLFLCTLWEFHIHIQCILKYPPLPQSTPKILLPISSHSLNNSVQLVLLKISAKNPCAWGFSEQHSRWDNALERLAPFLTEVKLCYNYISVSRILFGEWTVTSCHPSKNPHSDYSAFPYVFNTYSKIPMFIISV